MSAEPNKKIMTYALYVCKQIGNFKKKGKEGRKRRKLAFPHREFEHHCLRWTRIDLDPAEGEDFHSQIRGRRWDKDGQQHQNSEKRVQGTNEEYQTRDSPVCETGTQNYWMIPKVRRIHSKLKSLDFPLLAAENYGKFLTGKYHNRICTWVDDAQ